MKQKQMGLEVITHWKLDNLEIHQVWDELLSNVWNIKLLKFGEKYLLQSLNECFWSLHFKVFNVTEFSNLPFEALTANPFKIFMKLTPSLSHNNSIKNDWEFIVIVQLLLPGANMEKYFSEIYCSRHQPNWFLLCSEAEDGERHTTWKTCY